MNATSSFKPAMSDDIASNQSRYARERDEEVPHICTRCRRRPLYVEGSVFTAPSGEHRADVKQEQPEERRRRSVRARWVCGSLRSERVAVLGPASSPELRPGRVVGSYATAGPAPQRLTEPHVTCARTAPEHAPTVAAPGVWRVSEARHGASVPGRSVVPSIGSAA
jgi:hypothetical protein